MKIKISKIRKVRNKKSKNKDFCGIVIPSEQDKVLEYNQYVKSDKMAYIIYADIESLIKKIDGCSNNSKNSAITKIREHILCGYSMATI